MTAMGEDMEQKGSLLIVDDETLVIRSLIRVLGEERYAILSTSDPEEALATLRGTAVDVIICDQRMPEMTGLELLMKAREISPGTVRILMSGYSDIKIVIAAVNEGRIFQYIDKPWDNGKLLEAVDNAVRHKREADEKDRITDSLLKDKEKWSDIVSSLTHELVKKKESTVNALLKILMVKDHELYLHSMRVAGMAVALAGGMGLRPKALENLRKAGIFHDIGKISIRDQILYKSSSLDIEEFKEMKGHPAASADILREVDFMGPVAGIVEQHHEWLDGSGYPKGLREDGILVEAQILAVADSYDALATERVYRAKLSPREAVEILRAQRGSHYNGEIVERLASIVLAEG